MELDQQRQVNTQLNAGRDNNVDHIGDVVIGDKFSLGDVIGSYAAIGAGAQVIIHEAASRSREVKLEEQYLSELIAGSIARQLVQFGQLAHKTIFAEVTNPYRALQSFDVEDAALFFGRQDDIQALLQLLTNPITILRSASGAGKSSLLKAGIASRLLAEGHLPVYIRPFHTSPTDTIKAWFLHGVGDHPELERARRESMTAFLQRVLNLFSDPRKIIVILIDQFEEFFYYLSEEEQRRFIYDLERCSVQLGRRVRWIFAIRDERFTELGAFCPPICLSFGQTHSLTWTATQARETILEPARHKGLKIDEELPSKIIDDLTTGERQLTPLHLQLICHTLYEVSDRTQLSVESYQSLGATQGILLSWLQRVLDGLPKEDQRAAAKFVLRELVDSRFHRIRRTQEEVAAAAIRESLLGRIDMGHVLGYLEANGLIRREGDGESAEYELTHDFLAERIEMAPETQARKLAQEMLNFDLFIYQRNATGLPILIPEDRLLLIEHNTYAEELTDEQRLLIRISREQADQQARQNRRKTRALLGSVFLIMLAIIAGLAAWVTRIQSTRHNARLAAAAELVLVPELGIRIEAHEITNERYGACIDEGVCTEPEGFLEARATWETSRLLPVVHVDLAEALLFCQWIGRTLPTYAEWTTVAPLEAWQSYAPEQALLCQDESECGRLRAVPVSARPQFVADGSDDKGIFDLVGSVEEWTRTLVDGHSLFDIENVAELATASGSVIVLGHDYRTNIEFVGAFPQFPSDSTDSFVGRSSRGFRCMER